MPTIKSLSTLRYVSAAVFFAALCNLNYRQQPAFAAYCQDFGGNKKVIFEGPNGGTFGAQETCEDYWNGQTPANICSQLCGGTCENGEPYDQCCEGSGGWSWNNGYVDCMCNLNR